MKIFKFINHSESYFYWMNYLDNQNNNCIIHVDKHSDFCALKNDIDTNSGNFLLRVLLSKLNVVKIIWIYPEILESAENSEKWLKNEFKSIYLQISKFFENTKIFYFSNYVKIVANKKQLLFTSSLNQIKFNKKYKYHVDIDCDAFCHFYKNRIFIDKKSIEELIKFIKLKNKNIDIVTIAYSFDGGYIPPQFMFIGDYINAEIKTISKKIKKYKEQDLYLFMLDIYSFSNNFKKGLKQMDLVFSQFKNQIIFKLNYFEFLVYNGQKEFSRQLFLKEKNKIPLNMLKVNGFGFFCFNESFIFKNKLSSCIFYLENTLIYDTFNIFIIWTLFIFYWYLENKEKQIHYLSIIINIFNINMEIMALLENQSDILKEILSIIVNLKDNNYNDTLTKLFIIEMQSKPDLYFEIKTSKKIMSQKI